MRAHTITTLTPRRHAWRRALALALAVCLLAIPASASGYSSVNALTGGSSDSNPPAGASDYSSVNSITGGASEPGAPASAQRIDPSYSSLNAITGPAPSEPTLVSSPSNTDDGFDWASAAIGAAAAMALVALGGAVLLTVRRRTTVSASAASMS